VVQPVHGDDDEPNPNPAEPELDRLHRHLPDAATGITATAEGTVTGTWWQEGFNIVNGILYLPVPEARWELVGQAAGFAALKFPSAPASADYSTGVEWLEFAG
jgi:hypothetical protein